jgi:hypothetical protein
VVALDTQVQILVHSGNILLLDYPNCMMVAPTPPLIILEPTFLNPDPYTYAYTNKQKTTTTHSVLLGLIHWCCDLQYYIQGGALNRGLFFADPPPSLLGAVSGKISEIR